MYRDHFAAKAARVSFTWSVLWRMGSTSEPPTPINCGNDYEERLLRSKRDADERLRHPKAVVRSLVFPDADLTLPTLLVTSEGKSKRIMLVEPRRAYGKRAIVQAEAPRALSNEVVDALAFEDGERWSLVRRGTSVYVVSTFRALPGDVATDCESTGDLLAEFDLPATAQTTITRKEADFPTEEVVEKKMQREVVWWPE